MRATTPAADAPRRYADGTTITRQGDIPPAPARIERGLVRLASVSPDGREVVIALLGPGDVLDEVALLDAPSDVTATAVAETLLRRLGDEPSELAAALARRLRVMTGLLEEAMLHDARARLLRRLQDLAGRGQVGALLPLTQEELGRMIGASRETVNRALRDLTARGALDAATRAAVRRGSPRR